MRRPDRNQASFPFVDETDDGPILLSFEAAAAERDRRELLEMIKQEIRAERRRRAMSQG